MIILVGGSFLTAHVSSTGWQLSNMTIKYEGLDLSNRNSHLIVSLYVKKAGAQNTSGIII